ncbi:MAG: signal peptidase II [Sulfurovum sp.]|nr:signal peptidase II [Sulfurovum sp.]MCB4744175.1 signal peptidase II [Sulfurovum sp.]MCB4746390.1 signal peptidase II [Sulfurovum sp.]MCB4749177.1 signal peptidase II [Sulfurovum sp.]MCB4750047.1 signal peptidase II [Sulfurovum sp.]
MRYFTIFLLAAVGTFVIDQEIKALFLEGFYKEGACIDLELHFNQGIAFSMFTFIGPYLKWIQIFIVVAILYSVLKENYLYRYAFPVGLFIGGALGNIYDRFVHKGVVDYVAWHCGFNFAVFNFADVAIDIAAVWVLIATYFFSKDKVDR